ncbi:[FeFe] hydrogenase H-cluster maturation GTPase HydF [Cellulosilyticum sp. I15G10I2]|uniref:[FeFe] hydrogenase H-cluster maturation GTPase HydF n=1 Tax=Cellulosilyticum sp. I15G10I2 TaxID=1892843 RepID=UPI00085BEC3B|nr:[FeFe] hydrogenase H-cluster maturation GTPase HydF [Cellulosilyticum sp. I15G10I2]
MELNNTPSADRLHIGLFGKRNAGKSSVINAITAQNLAIVSEVKGTTTDPVYKAMELLPLGPVMLIDTPGLDDEGELGRLRVQKSYQVLNKTDLAILVVDGTIGMMREDTDLIERFKEKSIPYIVILNKMDLVSREKLLLKDKHNEADKMIWVSTSTGENINELKEMIGKLVPQQESKFRIVADLLEPSDFVVLVVPIDKAAPKGRLILPQQQTIRDILEADATAIVVKEYELRETLENLGKKPKLVITDSQVFAKVSADTPKNIMLTSFSILFARYKGNLEEAVRGVMAVETLQDGDSVLISEGCTHHRQCDDIGTVKIPRWISQHTGKQIQFEFTSGREFPVDLSKYKAVIHCGGCMLNEREMKYRVQCAKDQQIPITNYGILIAYMQGILKRSVEPFPYIADLLEEV